MVRAWTKGVMVTLLWFLSAAPGAVLGDQIIFVDADAVGANNGSSWTDAFNYLQDALAAAASGDEIRIAQGVYRPDRGAGVERGGRGASFQLIDNVRIRGGYAGFGEPVPDARNIARYQTILSGDLGGNDVELSDPAELLNHPSRMDNCYNVVTATGCGETTILDGLTITGGNANGTQQRDRYGGGLHDGNITVIHCRIVGNSAYSGGGGVGCYGGTTLRQCAIMGNSAGSGGGVYGVKRIIDCTIEGNSTTQLGGGGLWILNQQSVVTNSTISNNHSAQHGGGVYVERCSPVFTRCVFAGNTAVGDGGGIYVDGGPEGEYPQLNQCRLTGNSAAGDGGGLHNYGYCQSRLNSCIVTGNNAGRDGGGMCDTFGAGSSLVNCTFAYNRATRRGGGICYDSELNAGRTIANCIVWYNVDGEGTSGVESQIYAKSGVGEIPLRYSCVQGWSDAGAGGRVGTIGANPLFIDADGADNIGGTDDDNLRLTMWSPCLDAGENSRVRAGTTDLDGKARIIHGRVDMGAYESDGYRWGVPPRYEVIDLGTLGGAESRAYGINEAGQVVGYSLTAEGEQHAFVWDESAGMIDLGTLGGDKSIAYAINNRGQVVGSARTASGKLHAFIWEQGRMTDIGVLPGGNCTEAVSINDAGQVVGTARKSETDYSWSRAFLWEDGVMADLGVLEGAGDSGAVGINARGQVVGTSGGRALLWDGAGGMRPLKQAQSTGLAINDAGSMLFSSGDRHFIWSPVGGVLGMDLAPNSQANAINGCGSVVGEFDYLNSGILHAFLWDSRLGLMDLNSLIHAGSGWKELCSASGINGKGQIAGWGVAADGKEHAFLARAIPADSYLVAHWKLDETAGDTAVDSAGQNDGRLAGGPQWQPFSGRVDGALSFDGSDDFVDCGRSEVFDITDQITIAAWVKIDSVNAPWQTIIAKGDSAWRLSTVGNEMRFHFAVGPGQHWHCLNSDTEVEAGQWHHVCGTYDGWYLRLYVDGVEDSASPVAKSDGVSTNTHSVFIGANEEKPGRYWSGMIDDVRIYSCPLTSAEVHELFMQAPLYVDIAAGGGEDGLSWASAFTSVQDALAAARPGSVIQVAQGTYKPDDGAGLTAGDRGATFQLIDGVTLRGGYAGSAGPYPGARDLKQYPTVLSGDLAGDDGPDFANNSENSYHVITGSWTDATAVLDGFTITGGNAERLGGGGMLNLYARATIRNCTFSGNVGARGGGMYNELGGPTVTATSFTGNVAFQESGAKNPRGGGIYNYKSNLVLRDCLIAENLTAAQAGEGGDGGGIFCGAGAATLVNCVLRSNSAQRFGGGMASWWPGRNTLVNCVFNNNSAGNESGGLDNYLNNCLLVNCTFFGNSAPSSGGLYNEQGTLELVNCIFHGNTDNGGDVEAAQIRSNNGTLTVEYSCVQGWSGALGGTGNMGADPQFLDADGADGTAGTEDDDLRLSEGSACIDGGDNAGLAPFVITDLDGRARVFNKVVDMGAYEFQATLRWYVDGKNGDDNNNGLTPETAFATIQKGIDSAEEGYTVLVYPGVYKEEIDFKGKAITVSGQGSDATILEAQNGYGVSFYSGEDANSVLKNMVIRNCGLAGIMVAGASPKITNVTVVNNKIGVAKFSWGQPDISNSIFWNNTEADLIGCEARYSCIEQGGGGEGNISLNPLFVDAPGGDYHLRSERGRYRPATGEWVLDDVTSPCVDRGDPAVNPEKERMPNGARLNMGAFGGTYYASMSEWPIVGDLNRDGVVNMADLAILAENWLVAAEWAK